MTKLSKQCELDMDRAIGGAYRLEDGREFWIDHAAVREIMARILPVITAECERHYMNGTRNPNVNNGAGA